MNLREIVHYEINKAISEEMGVSNAVREAGQQFTDTVAGIIRNKDGKKTMVADDVSKQTYAITETIMGKTFNISLTYYNFFNRKSFDANSGKINYNYAAITSDGKRYRHMYLICYGISGNIDKPSLYDSIYHELSHYFQGISGNSEIFKNDPKYVAAASFMMNGKYHERMISTLYYFAKRFEGDGYVNGLYGALSAMGNTVPRYEDLEGTDAYLAIKQFRECLNNVSENSNNNAYKEFCYSKFGITLMRLLKIAYSSYYRFMRNIGRVLIKYRQDMIGEGIHFGLTTNGNEIPLIF